MSGQILLILLTSVLASDESSLARENQESCVSQVDMFSAAVSEDSKGRKKAIQQIPQAQRMLMNHLELADKWTFWYHDASEGLDEHLSSEEWLQTLKRSETFRSYGQFLTQVKSFDKQNVPLRLYLFKNDIRPLWEDEANADGGKLLIYLPEERNPVYAFEAYLKVAVKVMCSDVGSRVCGTTFSYRPEYGATISVWTPVVWTPHRDKEMFNRFKKLIYEDEPLMRQPKIVFRPHKTSSSRNSRNLHPATHRRSYRSGVVRPPPGFEGSALSGPSWANNPCDVNQESSREISPATSSQVSEIVDLQKEKEAEEERKRKEEEAEAEELRRRIQLQEEEEERKKKEEEEAKTKKLARRLRQRENRRKRKQCKTSSSSSSSSDSEASNSEAASSSDEEDDHLEEEAPMMVVVPSVVADAPVAAPQVEKEASSYPKFLWPAVATVSTAALAAAPFVFPYLF